ncbi:hypothetical protein WR25_06285 [Diploscapter pachys]|uniref:Kinesin motor domain-containing protein n=1 Tax=Diploscapter pachys TaxID=2018661 RepID=A0A2A2LS27_9BILA|nr:hypothetical protein WR25_06285 [Diploscapter pachys]
MEREKSRPTTIQVAVRVAPCSSFDQNVEWKKTSDCSLVGQEHEVYTFGKTHTLTGSNGEPGIVQLAFRHIFETVTKSDDRQFMLRFAYIELYNEKIADLLVEPPNGYDLQIREDSTKSDSTTIEGLSEVVVTNEEQVEELLEAANGIRKVSTTNLNERSSRSHAIVRIAIESSDALRASSRCSFVYLLDLAGSENVKQAGTALDGKSRQEAANINKSLLALSNVISALAYNQTAKLKESAQFVNYRNSKLTRILKPSLGGNSRTLLVCCVSPHTRSESLSTLRFAQKARKIENCPVVCEVTEDGMLAKCLKEIEQLKKQLSEKKNSETQEDGDRQKLKALFAQILSAQSPLAVSSTQIQAKRNRRMTWGGGKLSALTALAPLDVAVGSFTRDDRALASPPNKRHKILDNIREDDVEISNRARLAESRSSAVGTGAATEDLEMTTCSTATAVENRERERLSSSRSPNQDVNNALLASKEVEELKQKVIELETVNAALIAQNGRIAEESEQLVGHLRNSIQDLTNTMDLYGLELNELKTQNAQLTLENRELHIKTEAANRILNEPSNDHNSTLNDLSIEVALLQTKFESVNKELEESKKKAGESESQLLQSATREEELQAELRALQKAVDGEKQTREEAVGKVRQLENEVDRLATIEVERDSLRACNDRLQESLEMHTSQLAEVQAKADTWPKEKCSLEASLESMMQEKETVQRKWNAALVEKKILEEAIAKINANSDSSNAVNMGEFTRQLAETMHQNESLKRNLDELRNAKEDIAKELSLIMQEASIQNLQNTLNHAY